MARGMITSGGVCGVIRFPSTARAIRHLPWDPNRKHLVMMGVEIPTEEGCRPLSRVTAHVGHSRT
jgi:hypothetical protein